MTHRLCGLALSLAVTLCAASAHGQAVVSAQAPAAAERAPAHAPEVAERAPAESGDHTLNNALLVGVSALSLGLAPLSIALLNPDLTLGESATVSLVGTLGVLCASSGAVLLVVGGGVLLMSPFFALLGEDNAALFALLGAVALGVGIGLVVLAPIVFSAAAYVDGGFGDSLGEIAAVSTVSTLTAGLTTLASFLLLADVDANDWLVGLAIASMSIFAANLAYGVTRALMLDEPAPATIMLTPPIPW